MTVPNRLPMPEFIALVAMQFSMVAFSVDGMLPALPDIAEQLSPSDRNRAQLVLTSFVLGMGLGTFFTGPLSDTFGRKKIIFGGAVLFIIGAGWAAQAEDLSHMIAARILQGIGVAGPRIVTLAIVRDLYEGRRMAQIMSYAMMVFTLVPAIAPYMGAFIIDAFGWRAIFISFILFAMISTGWLMLRQVETLPPEKRRPLRPGSLWLTTKECFSHRRFVMSAFTQALCYGVLFGSLSSTQQIFDQTYGRAETFPEWFALIALLGGIASIINARLVMALGMRRMIAVGFGGQAVISAIVLATGLTAGLPFALFIVWSVSVFFMIGFVIGNLNALAMEPLGHVAGLASSVLAGTATVMGVMIAVPVGYMFNGTTVPLSLSIMVLTGLGFWLVQRELR